MAQITYEDKVFLNQNSQIANMNKVNDSDLNEIKDVVNQNDTNVGDLLNLNTTDKSSLVNAINEIVNFYEKTDNGFVLKFSNGFMIQRKTMEFTKSFGNDGSSFSAENDMGDWDVPFNQLIDFDYSIGEIKGARSVWVGSNTYTSGVGPNSATETSCGKVTTLLTWQASATYNLSCTGYGLWK